jgi:hypothetical protein
MNWYSLSVQTEKEKATLNLEKFKPYQYYILLPKNHKNWSTSQTAFTFFPSQKIPQNRCFISWYWYLYHLNKLINWYLNILQCRNKKKRENIFYCQRHYLRENFIKWINNNKLVWKYLKSIAVIAFYVRYREHSSTRDIYMWGVSTEKPNLYRKRKMLLCQRKHKFY